MIDSHCHLDNLPDPDAAVGEAGLEALVSIGASPAHARAALAIAERNPQVFVVVGLHPTDAGSDSPQVRAEIEDLATRPKVVGIGESGVDYYWDAATPQAQLAALEWQLDLARRLDKPVVIHTRDKDGQVGAFHDCAAALENAGWGKGILHCFAGDPRLLEAGLALGYHVSFAGNLTYKNAHAMREAAAAVPLGRLLVETDSPYLAPMPHRGKPNRPALVRHTLEVLAQVRGLSFAEAEELTAANARRVYGLPGPGNA